MQEIPAMHHYHNAKPDYYSELFHLDLMKVMCYSTAVHKFAFPLCGRAS